MGLLNKDFFGILDDLQKFLVQTEWTSNDGNNSVLSQTQLFPKTAYPNYH